MGFKALGATVPENVPVSRRVASRRSAYVAVSPTEFPPVREACFHVLPDLP